ncbi:hypothetical protein [Mucilaginibacter defluvii]|uniref:Uncharacterized protein n=1 Tax=Mucilaginibacter defluvii TaxID=1196019 RepID=A0ABP9FSY6_9SPHI
MSTKIQFGADAAVNDGYKALDEYVGKLVTAMGELTETYKPDPQLVADAIVKLIGTPKGERPLRTVVDLSTGKFIEAINTSTQVEFNKTFEAYGLKELLA